MDIYSTYGTTECFVCKKNSHFGKLHVYLEIQVESHFLPPPEKMEPADYCQNWEHLLKLGLWDRAWGAGRYCLNDLVKWTSTSLNVIDSCSYGEKQQKWRPFWYSRWFTSTSKYFCRILILHSPGLEAKVRSVGSLKPWTANVKVGKWQIREMVKG